jgi:hypothetical protein
MQRSGSAPASIDGMMQRQPDVDYDQRSRFSSLGASPSETFLQEACFNNRSAPRSPVSPAPAVDPRAGRPWRLPPPPQLTQVPSARAGTTPARS